MATIEAYMRKSKNRAGLCPINICITKDRKSSYIHTGQRIDPKFWDSVKRKVKKNHPNSTRLNNLISFKLAEINESLLDIEAETKPLTRITEITKVIS
ncbi:Arm DNA-binding domain-containing protein [Maribacter aquivivus]|uniref:Arm DNA-binding domain-containing protein n=1 Tax=Maribacter aquivivus TaxID=228958 RepID=UPI0024938049|nr:Arm DNA-binding domain-containing protein [Maribacter aquivivus]